MIELIWIGWRIVLSLMPIWVSALIMLGIVIWLFLILICMDWLHKLVVYALENWNCFPSAIWYLRDRKLGIRKLNYHLSNHSGWRDLGWYWNLNQFYKNWFTYPLSYKNYCYRADILSGWVASRDAMKNPEEYHINPAEVISTRNFIIYKLWEWWYHLAGKQWHYLQDGD